MRVRISPIAMVLPHTICQGRLTKDAGKVGLVSRHIDDFAAPREFLVDQMRDIFQATASELGRRLGAAGYFVPRPSQIAIMSQLSMAGLRPSDLARRAQVSRQAIDQMVDQLEAARVLERVPDPSDRRSVLVRPTRYAAEGYAASRRILTELHGEWRQSLGDEAFAALEAAVDAIRAQLLPSSPDRAHTTDE